MFHLDFARSRIVSADASFFKGRGEKAGPFSIQTSAVSNEYLFRFLLNINLLELKKRTGVITDLSVAFQVK
jgi:hypothetical protein